MLYLQLKVGLISHVLCCVVLCCVVIRCQVVCIANQTTEAIMSSFNLQMEPIANQTTEAITCSFNLQMEPIANQTTEAIMSSFNLQMEPIANQTTEAITCSFNLQMEPIAKHNLSMIVFRPYYLLCTLLRLSKPPPREPSGRVPAPISQTNLSQCPAMSPLSYLSLITGSVEAFAKVRFHKTT